MNITDLKENDRRLEIAFEGFLVGNSVVYENVLFQKNSDGVLEVNSYSNYTNPAQISSQMAQDGIARSKKVLQALCENFPEYQPIIESSIKEYYFCCDYGKGAYALAKEIKGKYQWLM